MQIGARDWRNYVFFYLAISLSTHAQEVEMQIIILIIKRGGGGS